MLQANADRRRPVEQRPPDRHARRPADRPHPADLRRRPGGLHRRRERRRHARPGHRQRPVGRPTRGTATSRSPSSSTGPRSPAPLAAPDRPGASSTATASASGQTASDPNILDNGNIVGQGSTNGTARHRRLQRRDARATRRAPGSASTSRATSVVYQYVLPRLRRQHTDFFQVSTDGGPFISRTTGLVQAPTTRSGRAGASTYRQRRSTLRQLHRQPDQQRPGHHQLERRAGSSRRSTRASPGSSIGDPAALDGTYAPALTYGAPTRPAPAGSATSTTSSTPARSAATSSSPGPAAAAASATPGPNLHRPRRLARPEDRHRPDPGQPRRLRRHPEGRLLHRRLDRPPARRPGPDEHHAATSSRSRTTPFGDAAQADTQAPVPDLDPGRLAVRHPERPDAARTADRHPPGPLRLGRRRASSGRSTTARPGRSSPTSRFDARPGRRRLPAQRPRHRPDLSLGNDRPDHRPRRGQPGDPNVLLATTFGRGQFAIRLAPVVFPDTRSQLDPTTRPPPTAAAAAPTPPGSPIVTVAQPVIDGLSEQTAFGNIVRITHPRPDRPGQPAASSAATTRRQPATDRSRPTRPTRPASSGPGQPDRVHHQRRQDDRHPGDRRLGDPGQHRDAAVRPPGQAHLDRRRPATPGRSRLDPADDSSHGTEGHQRHAART